MSFVEFWESLRDLNLASVAVRIAFAALAGAMVGVEREFHGRAAGLRTHMLVCLGASLTAMIGLYTAQYMQGLGLSSDVQRTGAQVMSGVGFLGAGTILLKQGDSRITGLTTAAGLWATAAIGLAVGYGMYEAALFTVVAVEIAFTLVSKLEFGVSGKRQRSFVYIEVENVDCVRNAVKNLRENFSAIEIQVTPPRSGVSGQVGVQALVRISHNASVAESIEALQTIPHVVYALRIR